MWKTHGMHLTERLICIAMFRSTHFKLYKTMAKPLVKYCYWVSDSVNEQKFQNWEHLKTYMVGMSEVCKKLENNGILEQIITNKKDVDKMGE